MSCLLCFLHEFSIQNNIDPRAKMGHHSKNVDRHSEDRSQILIVLYAQRNMTDLVYNLCMKKRKRNKKHIVMIVALVVVSLVVCGLAFTELSKFSRNAQELKEYWQSQ